VILSHGWGGRGAQLRAFVPVLVEAGYQAVVFDHAGHGLSEGKQSSLIDFGRGIGAVARAVESRGAAIAGVVGHSLGAAAIAPFLRATGQRVRSVLVAPPPPSWATPRVHEEAGPGRGASRPAAIVHRAPLWGALGRTRAAALRRLARCARPRDHDEGDADVRLAAGLAVAQAWPGARFVRTTGLGHNAILRDPGVVRDAVDFIRGEVVFAPPPARDEWSAFPGPAPLF